MSNILTDIMGFWKRRKFIQKAKDEDVIVIGVNESSQGTGIAGPVPVQDARLIKVKDLLSISDCLYQNIGTGAGVYSGKTTVNDQCYENFKSLKSVSLNLSVTDTGSEIQFNTTGEPNTAANVGTGAKVYKTKVGEELRFRTITSTDSSVTIQENADTIDLSAAGTPTVSDKIEELGTKVETIDDGLGVCEIKFTTNSVDRWEISCDGHILPKANAAYDIGSAEQKVRHLFLSDNSLKFVDGLNTQFPLGVDDGKLLFNGEYIWTKLTTIGAPGSDPSIIGDTLNIPPALSPDSNQELLDIVIFQGTNTDPDQYATFDIPDITANPVDPLGRGLFRLDPASPANSFQIVSYKTGSWDHSLDSGDILRVVYEGMVESSVNPTVIYMGLHHLGVPAGVLAEDCSYGWQVVGTDSDSDNQPSLVRAIWDIPFSSLLNTSGTAANIGDQVVLQIYAGSNASGDKLLFGNYHIGEAIPLSGIDDTRVGPADLSLYKIKAASYNQHGEYLIE